MLPSIADGTILVATGPSAFSSQNQTSFPIGIIGVNPHNGLQSQLSTGGMFSLPSYIAEAPNQQLYVTDLTAFGTGAIIQIDPNTGQQTLVAKGGSLIGPNVLVYKNGFLYVADEGNSSGTVHNIVQIDPNTGQQRLITDGSNGGFSVPVGMASAPGNNLYVADEPGNVQGSDPGKIWLVNLDTGQQTIVSSNNSTQGMLFNHPVDIALDGNGNLIVGNTGSASNNYAGSVLRINPQTGAQTLVSSFGPDTGLDSVEVGPDGTIFVGAISSGNTPGRIYSVNPGTGAQGITTSDANLSLVEGIRVFHVTASSATAVVTSTNPSVSGQAVTFTATVSSSGTGTPTGTVTFLDGTTSIGQGTLSTTGGVTSTSFTTATLSTATHVITASYNGDTNFNTSTAAALTQTVNKASTSMAVAASANPSVSGQSLTFTATVTVTGPGNTAAANPTGVVIFADGGTSIGQGTLSTTAGTTTASFSTSSLTQGSHTITASYGGDTNFLASTASFTQTVNQAATMMAVTSAPNPAMSGQMVTFTATVSVSAPGSAAAASPTGTVMFLDNGNSMAQGALSIGGGTTSASFTTSSLSVGSHTITASYGGDTNFLASTGTITQTVGTANTNTTVVASVNPSIWGQSVTFTATVTGNGSNNPTGLVIFSDGGTSIGQGILSTSGSTTTASFSTSSLTVGSHTITASYGGDMNSTPSSGTLTQTVAKGISTTAVGSSTNASVLGQSVTFTATVSGNGPSSPTGLVIFTDGGTSIGQGSLTSSGGLTTASFSTASLSVASHPITASYAGDSNFLASSGTLTQTVNQAVTTTAIISAANASVSGQLVTFTATVMVNGPGSTATANPTGMVIFSDGSRSLGQGTLSTNGGVTTASFSTSSLAVGSHTLTASYGGDSNFLASTGTITQTVGKANTTTAVVSSVTPSVFGQTATFTAMVMISGPGGNAVANPAGTVIFLDNGISIGQGTLNTSGGTTTASFSTASLTVASHTITAFYGGDNNFLASRGTLTQAVGKASTTLAIGSSVTPAVSGQIVTFTATVTISGSGSTAVASPTGLVIFTDGGTSIGQGSLTSSGGLTTASFSTASLSVASHPITASYAGDSNFLASSGTLTQTVNQAVTTTAIVSAANASMFGQLVTFTATVTVSGPGSTALASPTGMVIFSDGGTSIGQGALSTSGGTTTASFSTANLAVGSHTIIASYSGDSNFRNSAGPLTQIVNQDTTTANVTSPAIHSAFGQMVTFMVIVSVQSPGADIPTGTVQFQIDGNNVGSPVSVSASGSAAVASFSTASLAVGSHTVTASYSGDSNSIGSTGAITQSVSQGATAVAVASSITPSVSGQSASFTATVSVQDPGTSPPTGTVQFQIDGSNAGSPVSIGTSGGVTTATFTTAILEVGTHTITASYSGDVSFAGSSGSMAQRVDKANTNTVLGSAAPAVSGQTVTFTATVGMSGPGSTAVASPTGLVIFADGGISIGQGTLNTNGGVTTASFSTSSLAVGSHTISASYGGDSNFLASTGTITQTVGKANTSLSVVSSVLPAVSGQMIAFTATLTIRGPGSAAVAKPTGVVIFSDGATSIGQGTLSTAGGTTTASFSTASLTVASHTIIASYGGDSNFLASTGTATQTVSKANTTTAVIAFANPSVSGQSVTIMATVSVQSPGTGTPTGIVQFQIDGSDARSPVSVSTTGGMTTAAFTTPTLSVGTHTIAVWYSGDSNFLASSAVLTQTVGNASTTTAVVSSANPSVWGQSETFTATVMVSGLGSTVVANPTGVVIFSDDGTSIGQGILSTSGGSTMASFSTSTLAAGSHTLTASYAGDSNFLASTDTLSQTVNQANTTTLLLVSASAPAFGKPIALTATVSSSTAGSDTMTGTVTFLDQGTPLATVPLSGGTATFTTSSLSLGGHSLSATYSGDVNQIASSSAAAAVTVGTPNERFVGQLYQSLLQRQPDAVGLAAWTAALDQGLSRAQVARAIEQSLEFRLDQVQALYLEFLHRNADPSGLNNFVAFLGAGGTLEQVSTILTSSPEYLQARGGGTNAGFLTALYQDALNRSPDAGGLAAFTQALSLGVSRQQVAAALFASTEYLQDLVGSFYPSYLKRAADNGGRNAFVQDLRAGVPDQAVLAALLGSDEFFSHV